MFSPNFRTQENEDAFTRKPDHRPAGSRKPFVDRSVNETPFQKNKVFPSKPAYMPQEKVQPAKIKTPEKKYSDWLLDICSFKEDVDDYWDIPSLDGALEEGLSSYFRSPTPPPILKNVDAFQFHMFIMPEDNPINYCKMEEIHDEPMIPFIEMEF